MQSTACNAVHSVEQRLARWLLMAHDRVERDEFPLTQEFAAMMLGATRQTVTVVAGTLQRADLIAYQRGRITIVDRPGPGTSVLRVLRDLDRAARRRHERPPEVVVRAGARVSWHGRTGRGRGRGR